MYKQTLITIFIFSFIFSTDTINSFKVYATTNVNGETEPCG